VGLPLELLELGEVGGEYPEGSCRKAGRLLRALEGRFRYHGRHQAIRHADAYEVHNSPWDTIPGLAGKPNWDDARAHFLYTLGPTIVPPHAVKSGLVRSLRVWAAIDLLLTCDSVLEARDKTRERMATAGEIL
jgi:hypothetical protein